MATIHKGRHMARLDGDFVVFVIGMRFNKLWKVHRWLPVFTAMPKMLAHLMRNPDKGLLAARTMWSGKTVTMIQYWRSFEQLEHFARNQDDPHLEPWRAFNRKVGGSGDVGIFHETYKVGAGTHESIYANMPAIGLAAAGEMVDVRAGRESARERITAEA